MELEQAVAQWKHSFRVTDVYQHPSLFVAHYDPDFVGSMWVPKRNGHLALWLAAPFAYSDLRATFLITDIFHRLHVTRMSSDGRGCRITNWAVPYRITDYGEPRFGPAAYQPDPAYPRAVDMVVNQRLSGEPHYTISQAIEAVREVVNADL